MYKVQSLLQLSPIRSYIFDDPSILGNNPILVGSVIIFVGYKTI